jgi:extracellular elastinolytic metalloproteinase
LIKEIDLRNFDTNSESFRLNETKTSKKISKKTIGNYNIRIKNMDIFSGNPSDIIVESAPKTPNDYVTRSLDYLNNISTTFGFDESKEQQPEFDADPHVQKTSSNATAVHVNQNYKGIPIFQASTTVKFTPNDEINGSVGNIFTITKELNHSITISSSDAVMKVIEVIKESPQESSHEDQFGEIGNAPSLNLDNFSPQIDEERNDKQRTTFFKKGPFGDRIKASLTWFPLNSNDFRLGWEIITTMPNFTDQYLTIVDTIDGKILYNSQIIWSLEGKMNIFSKDGGLERKFVKIPMNVQEYGLPIPNELPPNFPDQWIDENNNNFAIGNNVFAHLGESNPPPCQGQIIDGEITFNPQEHHGDEQKVLNIFYYNCYMHDFFYLLGFREQDGNFQKENFGRGGLKSDRVDARSHPGQIQGTANMVTPIDGLTPVMNMGLVTRSNRHTAFDSDVVFHEFTHGVTNRLVGGRMTPNTLLEPQSRAMGEGWGDFIACYINDKTVVADWVTDNTNGMRNFPYDDDYPFGYEVLGKVVNHQGRQINYTGKRLDDGRPAPHTPGEIWCTTLCMINRIVQSFMQEHRGIEKSSIFLQLVIDALKLSPSNPSFLNMRDAILNALDDKYNRQSSSSLDPEKEEEYQRIRTIIWTIFAKKGMGINAQSTSAQMTGIVANNETPSDLVSIN